MTSPPGVEPDNLSASCPTGSTRAGGGRQSNHIRKITHPEVGYVVFIFEKRPERTVPSTLYLRTPRSDRRGIVRVGTGIGNEPATIHVHLYATTLGNGRYQNKKQGRGPALGSENVGYERAKSADREWTIRSKGYAYICYYGRQLCLFPKRLADVYEHAKHIIDILPLGPAEVFSSPVTEVPHQAGPSTITHTGSSAPNIIGPRPERVQRHDSFKARRCPFKIGNGHANGSTKRNMYPQKPGPSMIEEDKRLQKGRNRVSSPSAHLRHAKHETAQNKARRRKDCFVPSFIKDHYTNRTCAPTLVSLDCKVDGMFTSGTKYIKAAGEGGPRVCGRNNNKRRTGTESNPVHHADPLGYMRVYMEWRGWRQHECAILGDVDEHPCMYGKTLQSQGQRPTTSRGKGEQHCISLLRKVSSATKELRAAIIRESRAHCRKEGEKDRITAYISPHTNRTYRGRAPTPPMMWWLEETKRESCIGPLKSASDGSKSEMGGMPRHTKHSSSCVANNIPRLAASGCQKDSNLVHYAYPIGYDGLAGKTIIGAKFPHQRPIKTKGSLLWTVCLNGTRTASLEVEAGPCTFLSRERTCWVGRKHEVCTIRIQIARMDPMPSSRTQNPIA
ncbi:hypothetical protein EV421DRAFT_1735316 [Armillaria borealis]|uniref:Uncharacterized protein n=1 Tax=Armillaria borealis TaxID=47425 RepID=A0AA39JKR1_9AGAR|nr:hypothetical protein EV421DRAFT_1735316 [Armillaria borealis]